MVKRHNRLAVAFSVGSDAVLGVVAFLLAYVLRFRAGIIPVTKGYPPFHQYVHVLPFIGLLVPLAFHFQGLYRLRRGRSRVDDFFAVFIGSVVAVVLGVVSTLYFQAYYVNPFLKDRGAYEVSQVVWALFLVFNIAFAYGSRELAREILEHRWREGVGLKRILIAGAGELGRLVADKIIQHRELGYQVVGFVDDRAGGDHLGYRGLPLLGVLTEAAEIVQRERIDHLYVALPLDEHVKMLDLIESTSREMVDVKVVPDLLQFLALRARLEDLDGVPIINIHDVPLQGFNSALKRLIDVAISAVALIVLAIPFAIIGLVIRLTSPGPVFYRQERMGLDGRAFTVCKFRSMRPDAEDDTGPVWARDDDPRRAAAALERAEGRHVAGRSPAGTSVLRRPVQAPVPAVHAPAQGQVGDHRVGAGQRLARQHLDREADRIRPLLHRELVGVAGFQDYLVDAAQGRPSETGVSRAMNPTHPPRWTISA